MIFSRFLSRPYSMRPANTAYSRINPFSSFLRTDQGAPRVVAWIINSRNNAQTFKTQHPSGSDLDIPFFKYRVRMDTGPGISILCLVPAATQTALCEGTTQDPCDVWTITTP